MLEIKFYGIREIATGLKITERTVYNYVKDGKLKAVKIGGKWQVAEDNLRMFLTGQK